MTFDDQTKYICYFSATYLIFGKYMRWQIAQFIFCDQQQTLTSADETVQLEPMMVELLSYFCQHGDQIVSKDLLIEQVWLGRIVSDNAVSKLITKLRKVFADDVRQPKFIATFPKKGYKFIADVQAITEEDVQKNLSNSQSVENKTPKVKTDADKLLNVQFLKLLAIIIVVMVLAFTVFSLLTPPQDQKVPAVSNYAKMLTTDVGDEFFPAFSPDGTRLAYMSAKSDRMHLMVKNVLDGRIVEVFHKNSAQEEIGAGPANWSDDGTLLVYLVATPELCQYYIRSISGLELGEAKLIHNCPAGSYGKIAFTHNNNRLIYSESEGRNAPYTLFEIDLITNKKKRLTQPEIFLGGNSQFDLHPTKNQLLISSPDKQQWEGFYSLDLVSEKLTLLFKQDAYICCGIWSHDGKRVVLMGEHPAYQLLSYDLTGKYKKVIHSGSRQIRFPRRHTNGVDFLFSSGKDDHNVQVLDLITSKQQVITNDSVDEKLAVFSDEHNRIAYVGVSSGNEEVWLTNTENNQREKLTQFNDGRHYVDLIWSPAGEYLAALTLNEIHLINSKTGLFERLKIPQTEIRGVSFKSEGIISYSIKNNHQWRVYSYYLNTHQVEPEDTKWQFIQYHSKSENTLWLNQENKLFFGKLLNPVIKQKVSASKLVNGRQFNLKKRGGSWYWFEYEEQGKIQRYSSQSTAITTLINTDVEHFDIAKNKLLFGNIQQVNANVYQTQSLGSE